jgi:hypothetical protein
MPRNIGFVGVLAQVGPNPSGILQQRENATLISRATVTQRKDMGDEAKPNFRTLTIWAARKGRRYWVFEWPDCFVVLNRFH